MNRLLTILLLLCATAHGQIDNPPTSVNIVDATATGRAVLTATNAAAAATAIGLGTTNNPIFSALTLGAGDELQINGSGIYSVGFGGQLEFETRKLDQNGLNVFAWSTNSFGVTPSATFATNVTVNGNISVGSLTTTTPSTWALDATQTAAATNGILTLPSTANVIRLTNNNAISSVTNGVLGAFYYLVNQTTNAVTISNVGGITVQGGTSLTLGANQAATLVATGATNASVAARGDLTDVALGGTANTAPSQTASSGASLMTRDLSDDRYSFSRWYSAADLLYLEQSTFIPAVNRGTSAGFSPLAAQMVTVLDVNTKWSLPIDYRVGGQVRVVSYWSDRVLTNSGGTNADIAVWTFPSAVQPSSNTISNNITQGTQIKTVYTANYGGTDNSRYYVVDQLVDFGTITNISATNPMQIKYVELQRRGVDATDTSTNSIYLSGVHIYVP